jgi:transcription elongation factor S-II
MDQRELDSRIKALQKAIAEKEPATNVITILEMLKNNVNPTEELLRVRQVAAERLPGG